jgi:hypothetical protein
MKNVKSSLIIEGLNHSRQKVNESYDDIPICHRSKDLQKLLSDTFSKKYLSVFKAVGAEALGVEVYTHEGSDAEDIIRIPDVIYEITLYIDLNMKTNPDVKAVEKLIASTLKRYPKFSYDKLSKQFYYTAEDDSSILDILDTLKADGANYSKFVSIKTGREVEQEVDAQMAEWKKDKEYQEREYRRDVLGTW